MDVSSSCNLYTSPSVCFRQSLEHSCLCGSMYLWSCWSRIYLPASLAIGSCCPAWRVQVMLLLISQLHAGGNIRCIRSIFHSCLISNNFVLFIRTSMHAGTWNLFFLFFFFCRDLKSVTCHHLCYKRYPLPWMAYNFYFSKRNLWQYHCFTAI